jgi:hypothetical protein
MDNNRHWVGTWATSPAPSDTGVGFDNLTLRMNPRVSIGGDRLHPSDLGYCEMGDAIDLALFD